VTFAELLHRRDRFARLRWVGVVLFVLALPLLPLAIYGVVLGVVRPLSILPTIGCLGLSLGAVGTANDTSLHAARTAAERGELPRAAASELAHEEAVRPQRLRDLHSSPKAAVVIPLVAAGLILYMGRLLAEKLAG